MWYAVYEKLTGKLYSTGTVLSDKIKPEFEVKELGENFDERGLVWDETNKQFIPDTRFQDILNSVLNLPGIVKLTITEKANLKKLVEKIMKGELIW